MEKVSDFISKKYKNYQYFHHVLKRCCYIEFINKLFIKTMKVQKKKKKKKKEKKYELIFVWKNNRNFNLFFLVWHKLK